MGYNDRSKPEFDLPESAHPERHLARQAIIKTLTYSDIFDFPLRKDEIWKFLISDKKISYKSFEECLKKIGGKQIYEKEGYYCLIGDEKNIERRKNNLQEIEKKLLIAKKAVSYLSRIPIVLFIGLSGGLAMSDADHADDIDFFIITKKHLLFTTRFLVLLVLEIIGLRRKKNGKNTSNMVCVNFLIDETSLTLSSDKHDIYVAHEIVQIKPLFEREDMYSKFILSNNWIKKFYSNSEIVGNKKKPKNLHKSNKVLRYLVFFVVIIPLECFMRKLQLAYMKKSNNQKNITNSSLAFYPNDYRVQVLNKMNLKLQQLGLLTKI